jgi:membrane-bound serine protease (ClpP class)
MPHTDFRTRAATQRAARRGFAFVATWLCATLIAAVAMIAPAQDEGRPANAAIVLALDGPVGPASASYVGRGLAQAAERGAPVVVLRIDTPGGLDDSMRIIIRAILAAPMPVIAWVGPSGARAASAGAFVLLASHVAAMAPGTNVGAATPVAIGGGGGAEDRGDDKAEKRGRGQPAVRGASETKALNDAVAYIRSLAEMRGRNADWAERAVREAASLPATEAVAAGAADLVATDIPSLLRTVNGREVRLPSGTVRLATDGIAIESVDPDLRTRVMAVLTHPNVALVLLLVGVYGLLFEFLAPGTLVPGVVGAIALVIALYGLSALPLAGAGVALLLLGVVLVAVEASTPSFGVLGLGGTVALVAGGALLVDTDVPDFTVSMPLLLGIALALPVIGFLALRAAWQARKQPIAGGTGWMTGRPGDVLDWAGTRGHVRVAGERWQATGPAGIAPGSVVRVVAVEGLTLRVVAADAAVAAADPHPATRPGNPP